MKTMKTIFYSLALSMFIGNIAYGYTHTFKNTTPHVVFMEAKYSSCQPTYLFLGPGESYTNTKVGGCVLEHVRGSAVVVQGCTPDQRSGGRWMQIGSFQKINASSYNGPYTGSSTWQMQEIVNADYSLSFQINRVH